MPRSILITAGPTHEPIDEVRYIANRSSGKMGIAIAEAARAAGWDVTLLLGPAVQQTPHNPPMPRPIFDIARGEEQGASSARGKGRGPTTPGEGQESAASESGGVQGLSSGSPSEFITIRFTTTEDLRRLLDEHFPVCDVLVMAAAVADYRPVKGTSGKIARGAERLTLELEPTPDLVAECAKRKRPDQFIVGFALEEPSRLRDRAVDKLKRKGVDAIVANPLDTMGSPTIDATVFGLTRTSGMIEEHQPSSMEKSEFARWLVEWIGRASNSKA